MLITLTWDPPTTKYYGHPLENLAGYYINHSTDGFSWRRLNSTPVTDNHYTADLPPGYHAFTVQAVDSSGNISQPSNLLELTIPNS